jgi:hypothetical protein
MHIRSANPSQATILSRNLSIHPEFPLSISIGSSYCQQRSSGQAKGNTDELFGNATKLGLGLYVFLNPFLGVFHHSCSGKIPKISTAMFQLYGWLPFTIFFDAECCTNRLVINHRSRPTSEFVRTFHYNDEKVRLGFIVKDDEIAFILFKSLTVSSNLGSAKPPSGTGAVFMTSLPGFPCHQQYQCLLLLQRFRLLVSGQVRQLS